MKKRLVTLALACTTLTAPALAAGAPEVGPSDSGTYVFLKQGAPTEMFLRLSKGGGQWIVEIKKPGGHWQNTICDQGCDYARSTAQQLQSYFATDWRANYDIACIQNVALAFCRYSDKSAPQRIAYVAFSLATDRPVSMHLRRVGQLENPLLTP